MLMKRITILLLLAALSSAITAFAIPGQKDLSGSICIKGTLKKEYLKAPAGTPVVIRRVVKQPTASVDNPSALLYAVEISGIQYGITHEETADIIAITPPKNGQEFWQQLYLRAKMYSHFERNGYRNELRQNVGNECVEYLNKLSDIAYTDELTQLYAEGIFAKLIPGNIDPKRTENLNIRIIQSAEPDAFMLPNGAMVISTGLLCTLDSEDELAAVLANEICHYALDHPITNIYTTERRAKRSLFWGNLLAETAQAAFEIGYWDSNDKAYTVSSVANLASIVALLSFPASNHMGIEYKKSQEKQADSFTLELLQATGYNPEGLSSALRKITNFYIKKQRTEDIARYGNIDRLKERLENINGQTTLEGGRPYLRNTSYAVTFNAGMNYANKRYKDALELVNKNIDNHLATEEDYLISIKSRMALENSEETNNQCLALLKEIQEMAGDTKNLDVCKQNILLLIRMNKQVAATDELRHYISYLSQYNMQNVPEEESEWIEKETQWAEDTLSRLNKI